MRHQRSYARLPRTLDLATFVNELLLGMPSTHQELDLATRVGVNEKTIKAWKDAQSTENGPSVHLTNDNFRTLCAEGRRQGRNMELYCCGPVLWSDGVLARPSSRVEIGKRFKVHGVKLAGVFLDSPLILTGGIFSDQASDIQWFFNSGFSGIETKTRLSHERAARTHDQLLGFRTPPSFESGNHPRPPLRLLTRDFRPQDEPFVGVGVRLGAPSSSPAVWAPETDSLIEEMSSGQCLLLSIGAHVKPANASDHSAILADWSKVAEHAAQTRAPIVVANVSCNTFSEYYEDLKLVAQVCATVRHVLKGQKLFVKLSYLPEDQLERLLQATGNDIDGVIGVNCESGLACSIDLEGSEGPIWGERDSRIGISGTSLFPLNVAFLQQFDRIRKRHASLRHLNIISCGGITQLEQVTRLLDLGADCVGLNSILFHDSYFGLKARRFVDSRWDRRKKRIGYEGARMREIWNIAYETEVESLSQTSPDFTVRHRNAIQLLDQVLLESRMRIGNVEQAAVSSGTQVDAMSVEDMCERIRDGF